jgi:hypothetical protein
VTNPKKNGRTLIGVLVLTLAFAAPVAATDSTGTTTESLSIAASISMVVPTSIAYIQGKALNTTNVAVTGLTTDNPAGLSVTVAVNTAGSNLIVPASRSLGAVAGGGGGWILEPQKAAPFPNGGEVERIDLAYAGAPVNSPASINFDSKVNASAYAPGSFTGSLNFKAATN